MTDKEKLQQLGKEIDELVTRKKEYDKASDKLGKVINKKMQQLEHLTEKVYKKERFTSNVQEI